MKERMQEIQGGSKAIKKGRLAFRWVWPSVVEGAFLALCRRGRIWGTSPYKARFSYQADRPRIGLTLPFAAPFGLLRQLALHVFPNPHRSTQESRAGSSWSNVSLA